jgi:L-cysteine:1D-myo-inositol 2-amino-2-deoxy-alpha-D-glucopyranoside ligase
MRLFNTQTQDVSTLEPRNNHIGLYVCGITPYDTTHAGHAFTYLSYDVLIRYLRYQDIDVTYVQNVTDIDDDIIRKSREVGLAWDELGARETAQFLKDMSDLNALDPDHYVAATAHIPEVITIVEKLIEQNLAYVANGSVYFSVESDPEFGKLSHIAPEEMLPIANERGNFPDDPNKRAPIDFILWQAAKPGEPTWQSPWGEGRPGWHIECSAMSTRYLGPTVDIHGGGYDLVFPHHECEIAQSENATGVQPFVRYWMHTAMVDYQGEKMSKSLGNLVLVKNALQDSPADALRLYLLSHHYRQPWEYQDEEIEIWESIVSELQEALETSTFGLEDVVDVSLIETRFFDALDEDLDTPGAIDALREIAQAILEASDDDDIRVAQRRLRELTGILGLTLQG